MLNLEAIKEIATATESKIVLLVLDGLGGLPHPDTGLTELESASTPNLDRLAGEGVCGMIDPVGRGITPGSAPGHLALFGYDPVSYTVGRGALAALGIDFELGAGDVAARGNFCTVDDGGTITDRRAGRIPTEKCAELCRMLDGAGCGHATVAVRPVREHRFLAVFGGGAMSSELSDSDPQRTGVPPGEVRPLSAAATGSARIANDFIARAKTILAGQQPANMVLLRGFAQRPELPQMGDVFALKPAAIAAYPMYRGLARAVGMQVLPTGTAIEQQFATLAASYGDFDFFFVHIKGTDSAGEDGDFARKAGIIEEVDRALAAVLELDPEVLIVTADHSTPALLKGHSWHPVPLLLRSRWCRPDKVHEFSERACSQGALGRFAATEVMPLALANALKLKKYGA